MRDCKNLFIEVIVLCFTTGLAHNGKTNQIHRYEQMHSFGLGRRVIPSFRRSNGGYEHPNPLPSEKPPQIALVRDPFPRLYQGIRRRNMDIRVFKKSFDYPPIDMDQRVSCESLVDCTISHLAIETEEGLPIILRGGVGYHHFTIIVRAKAGDPLKGTIMVYCKKPYEEN